MDNLIAEGKAKPMIVVMDRGAAVDPTAPRPQRNQGMRAAFNNKALENVFINEIIPMIDKQFRTIADRDHRAMAGLSMGGMQTRSIVMANPDKFSYVGMFSSGTFVPTEIKDLDTFKKAGKLVFMSFGGREGGAARIGDAAAEWNKIGIKGVSYVSPETAHEWHSWRRSLYEFAPLLFKEK